MEDPNMYKTHPACAVDQSCQRVSEDQAHDVEDSMESRPFRADSKMDLIHPD